MAGLLAAGGSWRRALSVPAGGEVSWNPPAPGAELVEQPAAGKSPHFPLGDDSPVSDKEQSGKAGKKAVAALAPERLCPSRGLPF